MQSAQQIATHPMPMLQSAMQSSPLPTNALQPATTMQPFPKSTTFQPVVPTGDYPDWYTNSNDDFDYRQFLSDSPLPSSGRESLFTSPQPFHGSYGRKLAFTDDSSAIGSALTSPQEPGPSGVGVSFSQALPASETPVFAKPWALELVMQVRRPPDQCSLQVYVIETSC